MRHAKVMSVMHERLQSANSLRLVDISAGTVVSEARAHASDVTDVAVVELESTMDLICSCFLPGITK